MSTPHPCTPLCRSPECPLFSRDTRDKTGFCRVGCTEPGRGRGGGARRGRTAGRTSGRGRRRRRGRRTAATVMTWTAVHHRQMASIRKSSAHTRKNTISTPTVLAVSRSQPIQGCSRDSDHALGEHRIDHRHEEQQAEQSDGDAELLGVRARRDLQAVDRALVGARKGRRARVVLVRQVRRRRQGRTASVRTTPRRSPEVSRAASSLTTRASQRRPSRRRTYTHLLVAGSWSRRSRR